MALSGTSTGESLTFKVVNSDRSKQIPVTDVNRINNLHGLFELVKKNEIVGKDVEFDDVRWHEDDDGTIFDDDGYFCQLPRGIVIMACAGKEVWQPLFKKAVSGSKDETDGGDEGDEDDEKSDQQLYGQTIQYILRRMHHNAGSGQDDTDGKKPDVEAGMSLLCDADPKSLACHLGLSLEAATDLQITLTLELDGLQMKRDLELLRRYKDLERDAKASDAQVPVAVGGR